MMEMLGMTDADIKKPSAEVWPEHATLVNILTLNPWRYGGLGGTHGIDWVQVEALCKLLGIKKAERKQLLRDLQVVEQAALPMLNA